MTSPKMATEMAIEMQICTIRHMRFLCAARSAIEPAGISTRTPPPSPGIPGHFAHPTPRPFSWTAPQAVRKRVIRDYRAALTRRASAALELQRLDGQELLQAELAELPAVPRLLVAAER